MTLYEAMDNLELALGDFRDHVQYDQVKTQALADVLGAVDRTQDHIDTWREGGFHT